LREGVRRAAGNGEIWGRLIVHASSMCGPKRRRTRPRGAPIGRLSTSGPVRDASRVRVAGHGQMLPTGRRRRQLASVRRWRCQDGATSVGARGNAPVADERVLRVVCTSRRRRGNRAYATGTEFGRGGARANAFGPTAHPATAKSEPSAGHSVNGALSAVRRQGRLPDRRSTAGTRQQSIADASWPQLRDLTRLHMLRPKRITPDEEPNSRAKGRADLNRDLSPRNTAISSCPILMTKSVGDIDALKF